MRSNIDRAANSVRLQNRQHEPPLATAVAPPPHQPPRAAFSHLYRDVLQHVLTFLPLRNLAAAACSSCALLVAARAPCCYPPATASAFQRCGGSSVNPAWPCPWQGGRFFEIRKRCQLTALTKSYLRHHVTAVNCNFVDISSINSWPTLTELRQLLTRMPQLRCLAAKVQLTDQGDLDQQAEPQLGQLGQQLTWLVLTVVLSQPAELACPFSGCFSW